MTTKKTLSAVDWINAGFSALGEGGSEAIKVEAIARSLKVSKGSFYWHFQGVSALKVAMLNHWMQTATHAIIETVESRDTDPKEQLRALIRSSAGDNDESNSGSKAEAAIRDWARYDPMATKALLEVDQQRLIFLEKLFRRSGIVPPQSRSFSNILYAALIGLQQLAHNGLANQQQDLPQLLERLLSDPTP